jgi:hypothetical protein
VLWRKPWVERLAKSSLGFSSFIEKRVFSNDLTESSLDSWGFGDAIRLRVSCLGYLFRDVMGSD